MKNYISVLSICFSSFACAQPLIPLPDISVSEVTRIEKTLSSDQMRKGQKYSHRALTGRPISLLLNSKVLD